MKIPKARRLPSGAWFIQLRLGGESIPVTAGTEKACSTQAQYLKAEYLAGKRDASPSTPVKLPTLSQMVDQYISDRSNSLSPSSLRSYRTMQRCRFQELMPRSLSDITDADLISACNAEAARCAPKTLTSSWRFLGSVLRHQCGRELPSVTLPQIPPNTRPWLDADEIKLFISAVHGTDVEIPALLALCSLRRSEIFGLRWEDVDLRRRRIHISGALVPDEHHHLVRKATNKNQSSTRYIPILMDELYTALSAAQQLTGPVVACHPDTVRRGINRICADAGLPQVGIHGLRYSFASLAYHLNIPEKATMEIGGWTDDQTMRKIYTRISQADVQRYTDHFSDFFKNANENANKN